MEHAVSNHYGIRGFPTLLLFYNVRANVTSEPQKTVYEYSGSRHANDLIQAANEALC